MKGKYHSKKQLLSQEEQRPNILGIDVLQTIRKERLRQVVFLSLLILPLYGFVTFYMYENLHNSSPVSLKTNYLIENLQGDTVGTWKSWNLDSGRTLTVNIINADTVSKEKIDAIKSAILDEQTVQVDNSQVNQGPAGTTSTYYLGWQGALEHTSKQSTQFYIPTHFNIIEDSKGEGDIVIKLETLADGDGYSGFTKSSTDGNQIIKSSITIYNVNELAPSQIGTITRHEFGHALGLAHSTDPEDLMHATIQTDYPFISECDIDAITGLYNGDQSSQVVCEK